MTLLLKDMPQRAALTNFIEAYRRYRTCHLWLRLAKTLLFQSLFVALLGGMIYLAVTQLVRGNYVTGALASLTVPFLLLGTYLYWWCTCGGFVKWLRDDWSRWGKMCLSRHGKRCAELTELYLNPLWGTEDERGQLADDLLRAWHHMHEACGVPCLENLTPGTLGSDLHEGIRQLQALYPDDKD